MLESLAARLEESVAAIVAFLPEILAALALVAAGWLLAWMLGRWSRSGAGRLMTRLERHPKLAKSVEGTRAAGLVPRIVGTVVFWGILLLALAAAVEAVGLPVATGTLSRSVTFLPNVLAAILIVVGGILGGNLARALVSRGAASAGLARSAVVGRAVQAIVLVVAAVMAIEEIGIEGGLLVMLVTIAVGSAAAGIGLAFGLGAKTAMSNLIAAHYLAPGYRVGERVRIGAVEGRIIATTPTAVILEGPDGQITVPAKRFSEEVSVLLSRSS